MFAGLFAFALGLAAAAVEPADPVGTIGEGLVRLEAAWRAGDLHEVSHVADETLRLIEADDCPWRQDAALVAAMGFVAGHQEGPSSTGYSAFVADRVSDAFPDVLPDALLAVVTEAQAEPGEYVALDYRFARSPYLDPPRDTACAGARLDPALLIGEPERASSVIVALWVGEDERVPAGRAELLYAYPASAGAAVLAELRASGALLRSFQPVHVYALDPCASLQVGVGEYLRLCRVPEGPQEEGGAQ
ncbi:hypothetical protein E5163_12280 [Marinicauda algicola]|uniref:Uncharacterized protein n=1 Tax=Marinicauda algicola TaxID=2029849 RepID=A0A4S2H0H2_9PROT|nr:hypothetical protein [Marinicauda algicola]TGY88582.1 hypothetical protein E5163_12280 [Marinicauda algicola]